MSMHGKVSKSVRPRKQKYLKYGEKGAIITYADYLSGRLVEFWEVHPDAEQPLRAWYTEAQKASWNSPAEIQAANRSVSFLPNDRAVFNIKGNTYRLFVIVEYTQGKMFIWFVGTHAEYDGMDATII